VIATALRAGLDARDLADLDLAYAPQFGAAKDPVNMAGFVAGNVLAGDLVLWRGGDLADPDPAAVLLDVRSRSEFVAGHLPGALNIPHTQLRGRLAEVPPGRPIRVYCASGVRSYLAARILRQHGWADVASLSGGLRTLTLERPEVSLTVEPEPDPEWLWPAVLI
jgi:rhodanese-related sulfurtransferase